MEGMEFKKSKLNRCFDLTHGKISSSGYVGDPFFAIGTATNPGIHLNMRMNLAISLPMSSP
jgi:hypothetical protein